MPTAAAPHSPATGAGPAPADFLRDVLAGLARPEKHLPCKYFYDRRGSALFDEICATDEYYHARCELAILRRHAAEISSLLGPDVALIEYGSGSSVKTRLLLDRLPGATYLPVDLSRDHLHRAAAALAADYPRVRVVPIVADFARPFDLPPLGGRRAVYFSGSTISNFAPDDAVALLRQIAAQVGPAGALLIGVDLKKGRAILEPAYDDARGVTAAFNLNLLARMRRELRAEVDVEAFRHRAVWNEDQGRIEMYLVSTREQAVRVGGFTFPLAEGEAICTEHSYKFTVGEMAAMAARAGLEVRRVWTDDRGLFSVQYAKVGAAWG